MGAGGEGRGVGCGGIREAVSLQKNRYPDPSLGKKHYGCRKIVI
jgi:hypothetical protein